MRKLMLNFCHFWINDLMRVKVTEVGPPITLIVFDLSLSLAVVPDLTPDVLGRTKSGHFLSVSHYWDVCWLWRQIFVTEIEQCWSRCDWMRVAGPSWFSVSFSDCLGDQLPAITQACWLGTELDLFANPSDGAWQCKHGVSCLTQAQSLS